jgi:hypothetical protein
MNNRPRVVFLIPIASSRVAKDWHLACSYLRQTLASIFNSSNGNFCVVMAGHEAPDFELPQDPRFKFLSLDHPIASQDDYWGAAVRDKMIKLSAAWNYAKSIWNSDYVMKVDWDDLISSRLVDWLANAKDEAGYCINNGWIWRSRSRYIIQHTEQFDRFCGTCMIIRSDMADKTGPFRHSGDGVKFDDKNLLLEASDPYSLIPGAGTSTLLLNDTHKRSEAQFAYLGKKLAKVPFSAAIYSIGHGNNASGQYNRTHTLRMWLGRIWRTRVITPGLRREFNLP